MNPELTVAVRLSDGSQLHMPFAQEADGRAYLKETLPLLADSTAVITVTKRLEYPEPGPGQAGRSRVRVTTTVSHVPVNTIAAIDVITQVIESGAAPAQAAPTRI